MAQEIDLDFIALSPLAFKAWQEMAQRTAMMLHLSSKVILSIPDERARVNDNGTLTIFVYVPGVIDVSMDVPADQWTYLQ